MRNGSFSGTEPPEKTFVVRAESQEAVLVFDPCCLGCYGQEASVAVV